jgi:hypothetical protein
MYDIKMHINAQTTSTVLGDPFSVSGCEPLGVTWKQGGFADVVQLAEQHDNSFHANTSSTMRNGSILERINV